MRITTKLSKRVAAPSPAVAALIATLLETPNDQLASVFEPFTSWQLPRSDLHSWIDVLNKLDDVYERVIAEYEIETLQKNEFSHESRRTILETLKFQRLLLENSTNRKLFNSYDRLNCLLFSSDIDVVLATLQLILRPAQQYSAQTSVSQALRISTTRLRSLAKQWPRLQEQGVDLVDLASQDAKDCFVVENLPEECTEVHFTFYRKQQLSQDSPPSSGPTSLVISSLSRSDQTPFKALVEAIETYQIPTEDQFELLCRLRSSFALGKGRSSERIKLLIIRLLSIAIFAHTHPENEAHSTLFLYELDLISHISELLQLGRDIPTNVRTAALGSLDALARYRGKIQDVLSGVNAGVNHGVLMTLLRRTISDMSDPLTEVPQSFAEVLLTFISYLATHTFGGNMVIAAGLIPLLIQIAENRVPSRLSVVSKTMTLIDNILYGYPNAFQIFVGAGGVSAMVNRIEHEIDTDLREHEPNNGKSSLERVESLSVTRSALLKHLLRSVHRMMHSSGTSEGLRGLIDSSLVRSIKRVLDNRYLFGPTVLPLAVNVMTTFVHNEPTSLPVIQEAGLPEAFYDSIEQGLEPSIEVIQSVPNAIGALCLNQAGVDQLAAKPSLIPHFFGIFTSEKHVRVLQDKDNAAIIGSAIDELVRHHPTLGNQVFEAIAQTLDTLEKTGSSYQEVSGTEHMYQILGMGTQPPTEPTTEEPGSSNVIEDVEILEDDEPESGLQYANMKAENSIIASLDCFNRFLEGLFQHAQHCRDFIEKADGLNRIGRLLALPCLPYDYGTSLGSDALVQVMRTMVEASPTVTLTTLSKQVLVSLEQTRGFWAEVGGRSKLFDLLEPQGTERSAEVNVEFRNLVTLHTRVTLLSDVCQAAGVQQGRSINAVLQALTQQDVATMIPNLGAVYRCCIWEALVLNMQLNDLGLERDETSVTSLSSNLPLDPVASAASASAFILTTDSRPQNTTAAEPKVNGAESPSLASKERVKGNAKALGHLASQLPVTLQSFFQAIVKMFLFTRRNPDQSQRNQTRQAADMMASLLLDNLRLVQSESNLAIYFAYETSMIRLIDILLFDERASANALHTGLLLSLTRNEAMSTILSVCNSCTSSIARVATTASSSRSDFDNTELLRGLPCIKVAFRLILSLVSAKPLLESNQTSFLITSGKQPTDGDYFEPHDLLCRVRLQVAPFLRDMWRSPWLGTVASLVSKEVVNSLLEILDAEGEEPSGEMRQHPLVADLRAHRPTEPDEDRIRQLIDMGFPRPAAERALQRTGNNINAATEYLISHPLPFPPDPEPEAAPEHNITEPASNTDEPMATVEVHVGGSDEIVDPVAVQHDSAATPQAAPSANAPDTSAQPAIIPLEEIKLNLDNIRCSVKEDFGQIALRLLDQHPDLVFDLKPAFVGAGWKNDCLRTICEDIRTFGPSAHDLHESALSVRCRLLAIALHDPKSELQQGGAKDLMEHLLALLLANPNPVDAESPVTPKWLASLLLVIHSLLIKGEEPREISLPSPSEPILEESLYGGPLFEEARHVVFEACMRFITPPIVPSDELLAALRLLIHLTRDRSLAKVFQQRDGAALVLALVRNPTEPLTQAYVYISLLLRHVIEEQTALEGIMKREIMRKFTQSRTRVVDVQAFMKNSAPVVFRDPELFLKIAASVCDLVPTHPTVHHLSLKDAITESETVGAKEPPVSETAMQVDEALEPGEVENLTHFLINDLMRNGKAAVDYALQPSSSEDPTGQLSDIQSTKSNRPEKEADYIYACFLMQCLTELLFSYDSCKTAFLSYSKRRVASPQKDNKYRGSVLNYLLTDIICHSGLTKPDSADGRRRAVLSNWGMSIILACCVDTTSPDEKDHHADITSIRKFILDALSKALKEAASASSLEAHYGRLSSLADLTYRLLSVKGNFSATRERDDTPMHLAKMMLEKNFVSTLTATLVYVDLNYPGAKSLVSNILRPLEQLTKVAIKMGRSAVKKADQTEAVLAESDGSVSNGSDDDDDTAQDPQRQDTPDLYRNSALGMYGGEMEEVNFEGDPHDPGEDGDGIDDEDMEMEYEEVDTDSENTSDDMDESGGEDGVNGTNHGDSDGWDDEGEDNDDPDTVEGLEEHVGEMVAMEHGEMDHVGTADIADADDIDGDTGDMDEDEDEEDEIEEEGGVAGLPINDDLDEADDLNAHLEELNNEGETAEGDPGLQEGNIERIFSQWFQVPPGGTNNLPPPEIFARPSWNRRLSGDELQYNLATRQRTSADSTSDQISHPLLMVPGIPDASSHGRIRSTVGRTRGTAAISYGDLIASVDNLVGGTAIQILQQLMARGGIDREMVGLELPAGNIVATIGRNGQVIGQTRLAHASLQSRPPRERPSETGDFAPLPTAFRWSDEAKVTQGSYAAERSLKFGNHLVLALLPAARQAAAAAAAAAAAEEASERERNAELEAKALVDAGSPKQEANNTETASVPISELPAAQTSDVGSSRTVDDNDAPMAENVPIRSVPIEDGPGETVADAAFLVDTAAHAMEGITVTDDNTPHGDVEIPSRPADEEAVPTTEEENLQSAAGPSAAIERVHIMIHGNPIDITDTGIDPTFLEALPDDMREEVVNQHFRDQRNAAAARTSRPQDSQINADFLDALPAEIRAELLDQEAEQARRAQVRAMHPPDNANGNPGPVEMDSATFLATLDPALRQVVLLEQDEGFLQTLPSALLAEAGDYREVVQQRYAEAHRPREVLLGEPGTSRKITTHRETIHLLDKTGLATLVKLLFHPEVLRKNTLQKVLVNLCENTKARNELYNLFLLILQDASSDASEIARSRPSTLQSPRQSSTKATNRIKPGVFSDSDVLAAISADLSENLNSKLVIQKCLEALTEIANANDRASLFFLTEQDVPPSARKGTSKKGKGKERQGPTTHYPISPLLGLLDSNIMLRTPAMMDTLVALLAIITRPLDTFVEKPVEDAPDMQDEAANPVQNEEASVMNEPSHAASDQPLLAPNVMKPSEESKVREPADSVTPLLERAPKIPPEVLRLVVNIIAAGECSGKTFQHSLALIQHLSRIADAQCTIASELQSKAQELASAISSDLTALCASLRLAAGNGVAELEPHITAKFSSSSSDQAKFLRSLKTIEYMFTPKQAITTTESPPIEEENATNSSNTLHKIYDSFDFSAVWRLLGECLDFMAERADVESLATVLLALIESLMVVCKNTASSLGNGRRLEQPASPVAVVSATPSEELFLNFTDSHRTVLNLMVRNNPSLMSGSFSLLVNNSRVLDFDNKRNYFTQQLRRRPHSREHHVTLQLNVRRARVFEDSYQYLQRKTGEQIKHGKLSIHFYDEEGIDAGGVTREWFTILARQMFNPDYALFQPCAADKLTYQPNRASKINPEHLSFFKFVGRIIGKAIYDGRLLDAYFARSLFRQLLGKPVDYRDVEWVDPEYYKSLIWILENDPAPLDLNFIVEDSEFGVTNIIPLKENGATIAVTQNNRREYVQLSAEYRLVTSIKEQVDALLGGFYEIIPKDLISIFNEQEVELLISGTPDVNVDEWRAATDYHGYTSSDPVITWWWRALKSFNREERAKLLGFATGTARVPLGGFSELQGVQGVQRFSIHKAYGDVNRLPQAHTCFNQIDLPEYSSYEKLRTQLLTAINEGSTGFGFA